MRAKYVNKTARRRTIRPDGDQYRALRRIRSRRGPSKLAATLIGGGVIAVAYFLFFWR